MVPNLDSCQAQSVSRQARLPLHYRGYAFDVLKSNIYVKLMRKNQHNRLPAQQGFHIRNRWVL